MTYRASVLRGLALTQMVFGGLMFLLGVASAIFVRHWSSYVGFGIWVGVWVSFVIGLAWTILEPLISAWLCRSLAHLSNIRIYFPDIN